MNRPTEILEISRGYAKCALEGTDRTSWRKVVSEDGRGYAEVKGAKEDRTHWLELPEDEDEDEPTLTKSEAKEALKEGKTVYLHTFNGKKKVGGWDQRGWAYCPEDNAGFGASYAASGRCYSVESEESSREQFGARGKLDKDDAEQF